jgi:ABC-type nitrate/sulfonate/bicarbonate transport system permease component
MGYYIMDAWMRINYLDMYSGIIVLSLVGFLLFVLIDLMESTFLKWRNTNS